MRHVINASGVILHGSLKEVPLAEEAARSLDSKAGGLKWTGRSLAGTASCHDRKLEELFTSLTGAGDALVTGNILAAAYLVFSSLAKNRDIIVCGEELLFNELSSDLLRIVLNSGARLKEAGGRDCAAPAEFYGGAGPAFLLRIDSHAANGNGPQAAPGMTVVEITNNATLLDLSPYGLPAELSLQELLSAGTDLVICRGDTLLGGPPLGVVMGRKELISRLRREPMAGFFCPGSLDARVMEATLKLYFKESEALQKIPLLRMISAPPQSISGRAERLAERLKESLADKYDITVTAAEARVKEEPRAPWTIPSFQVAVSSTLVPAAEIGKMLAAGDFPVLARVEKEAVLLDLRSVPEDEDGLLMDSLLECLRAREKHDIQVLDTVPSMIWVLDRDGNFVYNNRTCDSFWGSKGGGLLGRKMEEVLDPEEAEVFREAGARVMETGERKRIEVRIKCPGGEDKWVDVILTPVFAGPGEVKGVTFTANDVTERKYNEEELKYISMHDSLTGLYNRAYFEEEMRRLDTDRHYPISVVIVDVDGLKLINDVMGHDRGDHLLKTVAGILRSSFRTSDVVARVGGDEFAVILPRTGEKTAREILHRAGSTVESFNGENGQFPIRISAGFATGTDPSEGIEKIFKRADNNMYTNKFARRENVKREFVEAFLALMEEKDFMDERQAERLRGMLAMLGKAVGVPADKINDMMLLSRVYDIGKAVLDESILWKKSPLDSREWEEIKRHPEVGYRIASTLPDLEPMAEFIIQHHERWDGRGYPRGLKGRDIHLYSRILTIVDAYNAMTSSRPYREPLSHEEAVRELEKHKGTQFDPSLVDIFVSMIDGSYEHS